VEVSKSGGVLVRVPVLARYGSQEQCSFSMRSVPFGPCALRKREPINADLLTAPSTAPERIRLGQVWVAGHDAITASERVSGANLIGGGRAGSIA
jgi:hypothetical protein